MLRPCVARTGHKIKRAIVLAQHKLTPYIHWPYQPRWGGRNLPIVGPIGLHSGSFSYTRHSVCFSLSIFTVLRNCVYRLFCRCVNFDIQLFSTVFVRVAHPEVSGPDLTIVGGLGRNRN